jgi:hypothetical protein
MLASAEKPKAWAVDIIAACGGRLIPVKVVRGVWMELVGLING